MTPFIDCQFIFLAASFKTECPPGTYSDPGATSCIPCNAGYICGMQSTTPSPADTCADGGWCDGKTYYFCPPGTYNNRTGSDDVSWCMSCPAGNVLRQKSLSFFLSFFLFHCCRSKNSETRLQLCYMTKYCKGGP